VNLEVFDVSLPLFEGMAVYEGDPQFRLKRTSSVEEDGVCLSEASLSLHAGTHVDAPAHYLADGRSIDELPPIVGRAKVLDLSSVKSEITGEDLRGCGLRKGDVALFKTSNSQLLGLKTFSHGFVSLSLGGAEYLVSREVKAAGIDYFSIESFHSERKPVHKLLLGAGIPIIEGLDLRKISPGVYSIFCLPLPIRGAEAAPARCILVR
jgi:arylformamidase